eukprot:1366491-Rhodomonas_salina.1
MVLCTVSRISPPRSQPIDQSKRSSKRHTIDTLPYKVHTLVQKPHGTLYFSTAYVQGWKLLVHCFTTDSTVALVYQTLRLLKRWPFICNGHELLRVALKILEVGTAGKSVVCVSPHKHLLKPSAAMGCCCSKQVDKIKEKVESKWVDELTDEAGYFHQYSEWQRIIQGGKNEEKPKEEEEGKEKKEKNRLQRAVMIKACGKVSSKIHASFLDVLHQGLGQGFSEAGAKTACSGRAGTGEIALVLNALSAVSLSYLYENTAIKRNAFAADNSVKFGKIRAFAIKRLATALSGLMALK